MIILKSWTFHFQTFLHRLSSWTSHLWSSHSSVDTCTYKEPMMIGVLLCVAGGPSPERDCLSHEHDHARRCDGDHLAPSERLRDDRRLHADAAAGGCGLFAPHLVLRTGLMFAPRARPRLRDWACDVTQEQHTNFCFPSFL